MSRKYSFELGLYVFNFPDLTEVYPVSANTWLDVSAKRELSGSGEITQSVFTNENYL